jgi:hypothetical protein
MPMRRLTDAPPVGSGDTGRGSVWAAPRCEEVSSMPEKETKKDIKKEHGKKEGEK